MVNAGTFTKKCLVKDDEYQLSVDEGGSEIQTSRVVIKSDLTHIQHVYIVGAEVVGFDSWNRESMSSEFVIFANANFDEVIVP